MSYHHHERLTALDAMFLELESASVHMHVGSVGLFDAKPLRTRHGGIDFERIKAMSGASLAMYPRFRQKLATIPLFGRPAWVDDTRFNLDYHLRHTSLPVPGDVRRLKRLAGRIMSQKLDRSRPLWEMWFVDGVEEDRFAVITKVHHCMIDGMSGVDLMASMMRLDDDPAVADAKPWVPRPPSTPAEMLRAELMRRASLPVAMLRGAGAALARPRQVLGSLGESAAGIVEAIGTGLAPASTTPLNPDIGPHRRFDWARFDLADVKAIKKRLGGTINDVVLACVTGAVRSFLHQRGIHVRDLDFRSMLPVSIRTGAERGTLGNRVSFLVARLPLAEKDPRRRLERVVAATQEIKGSRQVVGAEALEEISDWTHGGLFVQYARLAARTLAYNLVVTNVPGPQFPVYLLGARMLETYPLVPLFENQALGIALFSYDGGLFWGFNSDWDAMPDLHDFVRDVEDEFALLRKAAAPIEIAKPRAAARIRTARRPGARAVKRTRVRAS
jgi:diacylglycerol O-acyltransferase / wax synthase